MLLQLAIRNFALIDKIEIEFSEGLNTLTGETGAGKSLLIDALELVLGERLDTSLIRDKNLPAIVQANFSLSPEMRTLEIFSQYLSADDDFLILKREMNAEGRTRNFVNQQIVNLSTLKEIGTHLVDVHGQYDHQRIFNPASHLGIVDRFAEKMRNIKSFGSIKADYAKHYLHYAELIERKNRIMVEREHRDREIDLLTYQVQEIERVNPKPNEEESLKEEHIRLAHCEKLHELTTDILNILDDGDRSVSNLLSTSFRYWTDWIKIDASADDLKKRMESIQAETEDILRSIRDYRENLTFDANRLREIEERLDGIENIKKKYGRSISQALAFWTESKKRLDLLTNCDVYEKEITEEINRLLPVLKKLAREMTEARVKAAVELNKRIESELKDLGIRNAKFEGSHQMCDFGPEGCDRIEFLISPNIGEALRPLVKIASGGEASRLMLGIKRILAEVDTIPTLIFDEIDANVGGRLGTCVGEKLKSIASQRQVLLITHLPQIASFADRHFKIMKKVEKQKTRIEYKLLEGDERIRELAQMMSGEKETEISKAHAKEMLQSAVD